MVDVDPNRFEVALKFGATKAVNNAHGDAVQQIKDLTGGKGVDVAIEAIGIPATWDICQNIVKAGGNIANVGVHGKLVQFDIDRLWIANVTITTGLVSANTTPQLLKVVQSGNLDAGQLVTHHFKLDEMIDAYEVFGNAAKEEALKVILSAE